MARNYLTLGALALSVALMPGTAVFAGGSDIVGGIIGGVIGGAIVNEANKNRRTTTRTVTKKPAVSSYQREQNREVQTALNYFGYPVGTPDGVIGAKSRAAISQYQMLRGYPATGQITEVDLPRPRTRKALLDHPDYYLFREQVLSFLEDYEHGNTSKRASGETPEPDAKKSNRAAA